MSGIGFGEIIVLFLIGLIVLGPERLPRVAKQLGGWMGQARRMTRVMRRQLEDELDFEKDFGLKASSTTKPNVATPQYVHDTPTDFDDAYSPAHDAESIGSGVGDDLSPEPDRKPDPEPDQNLGDDLDGAHNEAGAPSDSVATVDADSATENVKPDADKSAPT